MKHVTLTALAVAGMILSGCGNDSKSSKKETVALVVGEPVSVYPGDTVTPENEETRISIRHEVGEEMKTVTLLAGGAGLLRGDYQAAQ